MISQQNNVETKYRIAIEDLENYNLVLTDRTEMLTETIRELEKQLAKEKKGQTSRL